jgi:purine-nucleoside phosphorylase
VNCARRDDERIDRIATALAGIGAQGAACAIVLGSGLAGLAAKLQRARTLDANDVPDVPRGIVPGHAGKFHVGEIGTTRVLVQAGRVHLYEGFSPADVTACVRAYARLGIGVLVLTNAAGGLRASLRPGSLLAIRDHLNFQGVTPLPRELAGSARVWDGGLLEDWRAAAEGVGETLESGVYAAVQGPAYETAAEIRHLAFAGADAVGMSTVQEALAGAAGGMAVAGLSCITNLAAGLSPERLDHADVLAQGRAAAERVVRLVEAAVPRFAHRRGAGTRG